MSRTQPDVDMTAVSFIISSNYREFVAEELLDGPQTPSQLSEGDETPDMAHVSRALTTMKDKGLTELLVPEDKKVGRIYALTEEGKQTAEYVTEM